MAVLAIGDRRLGAILLQLGVLGEAGLERGLEVHHQLDGRFSDILIDQGIVSELEIIQAIEKELGYPLVHFSALKPEPVVVALLDAKQALELSAFAFELKDDCLSVALVDALDNRIIERIEFLTGCLVKPHQILRKHLQAALAKYYPELRLENKSKTLTLEPVVLAAQVEAARALAAELNLSFIVDQSWIAIPEEVGNLFSRADALRFQALPIADSGLQITFLSARPRLQAGIQALFSKQVQMVVTTQSEIALCVKRMYTKSGRLGDKLLQYETIRREHLVEALKVMQSKNGTRFLGEVLVELGYATTEQIEGILETELLNTALLTENSEQQNAETLARSLSIMLRYEFINPRLYTPDARLTKLIPAYMARQQTVFPYSMRAGVLHVLMNDPRNLDLIDQLKVETGHNIMPIVGIESEIKKLINRFYEE